VEGVVAAPGVAPIAVAPGVAPLDVAPGVAPVAVAPGVAPVRAALICNPRSGALSRLDDPVAALQGAITAAGFQLVPVSHGGGDLEAQWHEAMAGGATLVFAAGGDGTLRALAGMALRDDVTLALLPGGTMNRVCARLGVTLDPVSSIALYHPGEETRLDVGLANGEVFLFESLLGAPARLLRFREMQRGGGWLGWLPLLRMAWRKLRTFDVGRVRLSLAGGERLRGSAAIVTLPAPGEPSQLAVGVTAQVSSWKRLRQALAWFRGRLAASPDARVLHTARLVAISRRRLMRISLDGEMHLLPPPVRYRIAPGALRILAPRA